MLAGPLEVLVGTPMPDRSKVRGQTKSNLPALQVWGFCIGLTTLSCKKLLLRKQQRVTGNTLLPYMPARRKGHESESNRTEWSPIQSVIIRAITKSDDRAAGVQFVYHEYDYRLNWTKTVSARHF